MAPYPPWPLMLSIALVRVLIVLLLVFGGLPYLLIPGQRGQGSSGVAGRAILMLFATTVIGHLLAFIGLYEGLILLVLLAGAAVIRFWTGYTPDERTGLVNRISLGALGMVDRLTGRRSAKTVPLLTMAMVRERITVWTTWPEWLVYLGTIGVAAWLLFDGAFRHAAPAFSDAPVTLKWMKLFAANQLYPDGVYPEGMYAFLSLLRKLTAQNDFLVMSVTGPVVGLLLVLVVGLFLRWTTGSTLAAAVGSLLYGTLPTLLPYEFSRHVGYNSQEFGLLFALPAAWFAYQYFIHGNRWHGAAAAAALGLAVFVHPVSGVAAGVLFAAGGLLGLVTGSERLGRLVRLAAMATVTCVLAVIPPIIGLTVMQRPWHGTSVDFLTGVDSIFLFIPDWPVLAVAALGLLTPFFLRKLGIPTLWLALVVALAAITVWIVPNVVPVAPMRTLALRVGEAGATGLAVLAGLAWFGIEQALKRFRRHRAFSALLCGAVALTAWAVLPPVVPEPPRMGTDEVITQVLRVDRNLVQGDWLLIMDNLGYSLALERGFHRFPSEFMAAARVGQERWCWEQDGRLTPGQYNVALFIDGRFSESALLKTWVEEHKAAAPLTAIHESPTLEVWLLSYKPDAKAEHARTWGITSSADCSLGTAASEPSHSGGK